MRVDIGVIVKSTEVSAIPAEAFHAKTNVRNHQLQCENGSNCSVQVEFLHVLLRFSCPFRLQPRVHCLWPAGRSILRFLLQCQHVLRLQCTATERDGSRGARVFTRCRTRVRHTSSTLGRSLSRRSSSSQACCWESFACTPTPQSCRAPVSALIGRVLRERSMRWIHR